MVDRGSLEMRELEIGEMILGRYVVLERIGGGGQSRVYAATDRVVGQDVVLKVGRNRHPDSVARLIREADVLCQLGPDVTVPIYDCCLLPEGVPCLITQRFGGRTLRHLIQQGVISPALTVRAGLAIARCLAAVHIRGTLHRDLKPANILVPTDPDGSNPIFDGLRLIDFGIQLMSSSGVGDAFGTPAFMAPEQLSGRVQTVAADLYALGIVLLQCLTGTTPFHSEERFWHPLSIEGPEGGIPKGHALMPPVVADQSLVSQRPFRALAGPLVLKKLLEEVPIPDDLPGPAGLRELIVELVRLDPSDRPPSAECVGVRLNQIVGTLSSTAKG